MTIHAFSIKRILQTSAYLQEHAYAQNYMKLLKLLFFADRYHLRKYGALITNDEYVAMKLGPVCANTDDVYTQNEIFLSSITSQERGLILENIDIKGKYEISVHPQDHDELSQSTMEALDFSIEHFGEFEPFVLSDISHDYPEWKKYETDLLSGRLRRSQMDLIDFFNNPNLHESRYIGKYLNGNDPYACDPKQLVTIKAGFLTLS